LHIVLGQLIQLKLRLVHGLEVRVQLIIQLKKMGSLVKNGLVFLFERYVLLFHFILEDLNLILSIFDLHLNISLLLLFLNELLGNLIMLSLMLIQIFDEIDLLLLKFQNFVLNVLRMILGNLKCVCKIANFLALLFNLQILLVDLNFARIQISRELSVLLLNNLAQSFTLFKFFILLLRQFDLFDQLILHSGELGRDLCEDLNLLLKSCLLRRLLNQFLILASLLRANLTETLLTQIELLLELEHVTLLFSDELLRLSQLLLKFMLLLGESGNIIGEERFVLSNSSLTLLNLLFHFFTYHNLRSLLFLNILVHLCNVLVFLLHLVEDLLPGSIDSFLQGCLFSNLLSQILLQKSNRLIKLLVMLVECGDFLIKALLISGKLLNFLSLLLDLMT